MSQETTAGSGTAAPQQELDVVAIRLAYLTVGLPILGTIGAVVYSIYFGLTATDIALFAVMYVITTIGVEGACTATSRTGLSRRRNP